MLLKGVEGSAELSAAWYAGRSRVLCGSAGHGLFGTTKLQPQVLAAGLSLGPFRKAQVHRVAAREGSHKTWSIVREERSLARLLLLRWHSSAARTPPAAGEGRSVLDPANAEFVESIRSGTCPRELDPLDPSKHVSPAVLLPVCSVSCCNLPQSFLQAVPPSAKNAS